MARTRTPPSDEFPIVRDPVLFQTADTVSVPGGMYLTAETILLTFHGPGPWLEAVAAVAAGRPRGATRRPVPFLPIPYVTAAAWQITSTDRRVLVEPGQLTYRFEMLIGFDDSDPENGRRLASYIVTDVMSLVAARAVAKAAEGGLALQPAPAPFPFGAVVTARRQAWRGHEGYRARGTFAPDRQFAFVPAWSYHGNVTDSWTGHRILCSAATRPAPTTAPTRQRVRRRTTPTAV